MNTRRSLLLASLPLLAAAGVALAVLRPWRPASSTGEPVPAEITDNTDALTTFGTLRFTATWGEQKEWRDGTQAQFHLITLDDQGRFAVDYEKNHHRYYFDGTQLLRYSGTPGYDAQSYAKLDQIALIWEDLWPEMRSGFANSSWILVDMKEEGFVGQRADND